ncbi:MAG TPA: gamma-glutamylcyclotransferase [Stellaceae bacterium]|nr:gamma-glutamylcyclotransferase [Stellaceae bacterium]
MTVADGGNTYVSIYPVDPMPEPIAALREGSEPVWLFAYGSLMWNPEFAFAEARPAYLYGYHRSFCLYSRDYRGTPERPGLVLGLDRGGSCHGIAYRLMPERVGEALDRIWAREMTGRVYQMRRVAVRTSEGAASAYACVVRRQSPDYAGRLPPEAAARLLAGAVGGRGTGRDYLASTVRHLAALGIRDGLLYRIDAHVNALAAVPEAAIRSEASSNAEIPPVLPQIADRPEDQS